MVLISEYLNTLLYNRSRYIKRIGGTILVAELVEKLDLEAAGILYR